MGILLANPITEFLGKMMNLIYEGLLLLGVDNIIYSIIIFTVIVYTLMLPFTIKQQKFTRVSAVMNPEIQAIQKKYKGKTDQASMLKQQDEMKLIYQKYGTTPTGGCLSSLIQLPILFALWPVIREVEKYVGKLATAKDDVYSFFILEDIRVNPSTLFNAATKPSFQIGAFLIAISIPVLAGVSQWLSMKTAQSTSKKNNSAQEENAMMNSMNTTLKIMPIFSVIMCFSMPIGLGVYWIVSAVVRMVQQIVINKVLDKKGLDTLIQENKEKMDKKNAKKKSVESKNVNSMAQRYTRRIEEMKAEVYADAEKRERQIDRSANHTTKPAPKAGSLAAKANMVNEYNQRNNK